MEKETKTEVIEAELYAWPIIEIGEIALLTEVGADYWIVHTKGFGRLPRNGEETLGKDF